MKNKEINNCERPWGRYFVLDDKPAYKIKRIEVEPKARLSYQYHNKRSETWVIIQGQGIVTIEGENKQISQGDTIIIPKTSKHRIENIGTDKLIFIEVQTGTYFGEDDIVRLQDDFNRA
tara:strand:- start:245 stop:601 length:357 start_codon:yes stop_codon:yes gene_type:complete